MKTFMCPHCGAVIPEDSPACPECGSDRETGWSEAYHADWLPAEEEPQERAPRRLAKKIAKYAGAVAAVLLVAGFISMQWPPYGFYLGCAVVVASIIAFFILRERPLSAKKREKILEGKLLALCGSDQELIDRLVKFEGYRTPGVSRVKLLQNAIDRLVRDRAR
jgi:hypothetical protein